MPPPTTAPGSLADALRTYFVAFLPLDGVDDALAEVSRRATAAAAVDRIDVFRVASAVLHDRARLTREVEALVLAMEVRLGVSGAADVLGIDAAQVEAVLLEVATAETSELPTLSPEPPRPAAVTPEPPVDEPKADGNLASVLDSDGSVGWPGLALAAVEAPDPASVLDHDPVAPSPEPPPHAAPAGRPAPASLEAPDREPPEAPPEAPVDSVAPESQESPVDRPSPEQTASTSDKPVLDVVEEDATPPVRDAPTGAAAAPSLPVVTGPGTAMEVVQPPVVEVSEAEVAAIAEAGVDETEAEVDEEVREARRGRLLVVVGLGIAVLLAAGLLVLGGADGFDEPPIDPEGLARVEGVVTLASAELGPGGQLDPPSESLTQLPAGAGAALHLRYAEERAELADALGVVWYRGGTELYRSSWRLAQPIGAWRAELPRQNTMATGDYRADVVVNGAVVHSVPFAVTAGGEAASAAPAAPAGR